MSEKPFVVEIEEEKKEVKEEAKEVLEQVKEKVELVDQACQFYSFTEDKSVQLSPKSEKEVEKEIEIKNVPEVVYKEVIKEVPV